jgi:hypothetical protein
MPEDVTVAERDGIIHAVYRGRARYDVVTAMLREVARIASSTGTRRVLFDMREADCRNYHIETVQHAQDGRALGFDPAFRIAYLGSPDEPMLSYFENVGVNRGYQVRAFTNADEAEAWLRRPGDVTSPG